MKLYWFFVFAAGLLLGCLLGFNLEKDETDWDNPPENVKIPSVSQLQKIVGAKVDGKLCAGWAVEGHSETGDKWDDYICNQEARKWDYYYD